MSALRPSGPQIRIQLAELSPRPLRLCSTPGSETGKLQAVCHRAGTLLKSADTAACFLHVKVHYAHSSDVRCGMRFLSVAGRVVNGAHGLVSGIDGEEYILETMETFGRGRRGGGGRDGSAGCC